MLFCILFYFDTTRCTILIHLTPTHVLKERLKIIFKSDSNLSHKSHLFHKSRFRQARQIVVSITFSNSLLDLLLLLLSPGNLLLPMLLIKPIHQLIQTPTMTHSPCIQSPAAICSLPTMQQVLL